MVKFTGGNDTPFKEYSLKDKVLIVLGVIGFFLAIGGFCALCGGIGYLVGGETGMELGVALAPVIIIIWIMTYILGHMRLGASA